MRPRVYDNELIKDLLQPSHLDLKLNEDPVRGMVVQGITEYGADSAHEILELLHRGNMHRAVEPTAANQVSSRSHAVFTLLLEQEVPVGGEEGGAAGTEGEAEEEAEYEADEEESEDE